MMQIDLGASTRGFSGRATAQRRKSIGYLGSGHWVVGNWDDPEVFNEQLGSA
ncbi:MAG: hypothetical protein Ct9H300mP7_3660 [Verrucomicrobiota bacterium]|nr:MAG: hypothetical protein Ct9H300mP7_3660 [Verrucomicrobiota bacterium]